MFEEDFITIQNKDFEIYSTNDYLIFTSQNAVESVLRNKKKEEILRYINGILYNKWPGSNKINFISSGFLIIKIDFTFIQS